MSEDPIGFGSGENNFYLYVYNNPLLYRDPRGLKVEYACEKSRLGLEDDIKKLRKLSKIFDDLYKELDARGETYLIQLRLDGVTEYMPSSRTIFINPNENIRMTISDGRSMAISTLRRIAHEFGHAAGTRDDGPDRMNNVNKWENPIMTPIDTYIRKEY